MNGRLIAGVEPWMVSSMKAEKLAGKDGSHRNVLPPWNLRDAEYEDF